MVGNSATRLACEFQKTEWRRHDSDMKPQRGRSIDGPSLRGLWGRSATGQNGQAVANKEVSAVWSGGWMSENISGVPAGRSVFHLTSPFIGLTENSRLQSPHWILSGHLLVSLDVFGTVFDLFFSAGLKLVYRLAGFDELERVDLGKMNLQLIANE
jgi:hypothetical protein